MPNTLRITLPEPLREWVERQISRKGYSTASDYVLDLLRHEQLQEMRDRVDRKLIEGLESGPAAEMTPQDWQEIRQAGRQRAATRRKKK
jgi:antitoxin ParD1/3/4